MYLDIVVRMMYLSMVTLSFTPYDRYINLYYCSGGDDNLLLGEISNVLTMAHVAADPTVSYSWQSQPQIFTLGVNLEVSSGKRLLRSW